MARITVKGVNYAVNILPRHQRKVWCDCWLPAWHEGRGRYLSLGLWLVVVYRGY